MYGDPDLSSFGRFTYPVHSFIHLITSLPSGACLFIHCSLEELKFFIQDLRYEAGMIHGCLGDTEAGYFFQSGRRLASQGPPEGWVFALEEMC